MTQKTSYHFQLEDDFIVTIPKGSVIRTEYREQYHSGDIVAVHIRKWGDAYIRIYRPNENSSISLLRLDAPDTGVTYQSGDFYIIGKVIGFDYEREGEQAMRNSIIVKSDRDITTTQKAICEMIVMIHDEKRIEGLQRYVSYLYRTDEGGEANA